MLEQEIYLHNMYKYLEQFWQHLGAYWISQDVDNKYWPVP